ncbi:MAG: prefoldin subunit alpha [Candidatus Methanolliviera hydrocarbonicum]|jgi:prefoldin, archaeal alpha subunit/eukaryotic subunit 5|uniref:Prefoldin subunit alpha n=1 Tax=Candidatus Methanolliviera hydrocarbonicum TaxID=2491085 RepID=A0A520KWL7_9EURY|nr:MAG: prefoldin subunit alpha [Candidatus Methanolliviera hydrocarbonicum]
MNGKEEVESELQKHVVLYRSYEEQMVALQQQKALMEMSIKECSGATDFIVLLDKKDRGDHDVETLVPIGSGTFISATIKDQGKAMVSIGGGYSVEKDIKDVKQFLEEKKKNLSDSLVKVDSKLAQVGQTLTYLQAKIEEITKK